jgi:hypothetical protein
MHTFGFGQAHCRDLLKWIQAKFIFYFYRFFYELLHILEVKGISGIFKRIKVFEKWENLKNSDGPILAHGLGSAWPT